MKTFKNGVLLSLASLIFFYASQVVAEPAVVFRADDTCEGYVPNGETEDGLPALSSWYGGRIHVVARDAGGEVFPGSGKLTCQGNHDVLDLQRAHIGTGALCFVPAQQYPGCVYVTSNTKVVATPSGEAHVTCQFKKDGTTFICL